MERYGKEVRNKNMEKLAYEKNDFFDDFPYANLYLSWDGLRIIRCKTKEDMEQIYWELKQCYVYVQKIETKKYNE